MNRLCRPELLLVLSLLTVSAPVAAGKRVVPDIGLTKMESGVFHSAAEAHCEDDSGAEVSCTFAGEHFIEDVTDRSHLIFQVIYSDSGGDYNGAIRETPQPDRCYIAKIWGDGFFLDRGERESPILCNPTRPMTPPDPWTLTPTLTGGSASPIVLDLDGGGFSFSDSAGGVRFDLDLNGYMERTAWLDPSRADGFLGLDRDGDGALTSGGELFGEHTPQPETGEPNGFLALGVYDAPAAGGNGNGQIDPGDLFFPLLRVWIDASHDGISQPDELAPLTTLGVTSIGLHYVEARRRDRHGNELRFKSRARRDGRTIQVVDVFLHREP